MNVDQWLTDDIAWQAFVSVDDYGKVTYAAIQTVKARVERKQTRVVNSEGQEVAVDTTVATLQAIGTRDRVWFPNLATGVIDTLALVSGVPTAASVQSARSPQATQHAKDRFDDLVLYEVFF